MSARMKVWKVLSMVGAGMMGLNLWACGILAINNWRFWVLFPTALLWAAAAYRHGASEARFAEK